MTAALGLAISCHAAGSEVIVQELQPLSYADARSALEDAMIDEGLAPASVSQFGEMLARTAKDLGHRSNFYEHAEIFSFCSARVSARMIAEDVRNIALCPMTIALYTLPGQDRKVFLVYREPDLDSPAGELARATLRRIVAQTLEHANGERRH